MRQETNGNRRNSLSMLGSPATIKIAAIGVLTHLFLIPTTMIESLMGGREQRQKQAAAEIGSKWGREQTIMGPVINVPYRSETGRVLHMHFLPETLHITGQVYPKVRYRGIFEAALYHTQLMLTGTFSYLPTEKLEIPDNDIDWSGVTICLGVSDMRGIGEPIVATVNDVKIHMNRGLNTNDLMPSGVSASIVPNRGTKKYAFKFVVNLNGSDGLCFVPAGKATTVSLSSVWQNPSFRGAHLPSERSVSEKGFTATWKVLDFNRAFPQYWIGNAYGKEVKSSSFGVGLFTPVDFYQKSMRTTKYAILFIVLIFLAFFVSEMAAKVRLHPIQYLFVGLAIVTFYTLLLSLPEHINFVTAYGLSGAAVIALVTAYARSILKRTRLAMIVGGVLAIIYGYSYWLLQMVDYALIAGSIGLFVGLSVIMFVTRNIDRYSIKVGSGSVMQQTGANAE